MSDEKKLAVVDTIKDGVGIGVKNIVPILVNVLLFILTCWIPYLNVGTTIGLGIGIIAKASRGEAISVTEIFDPKYRKYMGEFFLAAGLVGVGVSVGMTLFIIPGIVISLAWSLTTLLVVDKEKNPVEAISISNKLTYGYKWKIVGIYLLTWLAVAIVITILAIIPIPVIGSFLAAIAGIFSIFVFIGLQASIYKRLTEGV